MKNFVYRNSIAIAAVGFFSAVLATGLVSGRVLTGQQPKGTINGSNIPQIQDANPAQSQEDSVTSASVARQEQMRAHIAQDERHKRMIDDADKLLELVTELKSDVDKSTKYETSVAAIKKAAEIEKLARDVRERMRN
jgi:hypothetical protein